MTDKNCKHLGCRGQTQSEDTLTPKNAATGKFKREAGEWEAT